MSILLPYIINSSEAIKIVNEMKHFLISLIVVKWYDWYSIIDLKRKTIHRIIDNNNVFQVSVSKNPEIFHIVPLRG